MAIVKDGIANGLRMAEGVAKAWSAQFVGADSQQVRTAVGSIRWRDVPYAVPTATGYVWVDAGEESCPQPVLEPEQLRVLLE